MDSIMTSVRLFLLWQLSRIWYTFSLFRHSASKILDPLNIMGSFSLNNELNHNPLKGPWKNPQPFHHSYIIIGAKRQMLINALRNFSKGQGAKQTNLRIQLIQKEECQNRYILHSFEKRSSVCISTRPAARLVAKQIEGRSRLPSEMYCLEIDYINADYILSQINVYFKLNKPSLKRF